MTDEELPPEQYEIPNLLRWNIDHPGIISSNPRIDLEKWILTVDGEVEKPIKLSWGDFLKLKSIESVSDFHCVEGWSVRNCRWYGVNFKTLVELVKPAKGAKYVFFKCSDDYATSLNLKELLKDDVLLAYKLNNKPLDEPLGGPLRLIVPDKYAYKSAMWVEKITFTKKKELGFWEKRGYSDDADVWSNSRLR